MSLGKVFLGTTFALVLAAAVRPHPACKKLSYCFFTALRSHHFGGFTDLVSDARNERGCEGAHTDVRCS